MKSSEIGNSVNGVESQKNFFTGCKEFQGTFKTYVFLPQFTDKIKNVRFKSRKLIIDFVKTEIVFDHAH